TLGARRLADPALAVSRRPDDDGRGAQSPAAHQPLEDFRQPASQPDGPGAARVAGRRMDGPARPADRLDGDGPRRAVRAGAADARARADRAVAGPAAAGIPPPAGVG